MDRPFQSFEGRQLYPTALQKGAALMESLISNHPIVDGNKRTGYVVLRLYLLACGLDVYASEKEKYDFVVAIASGDLDFEAILHWLEQHER